MRARLSEAKQKQGTIPLKELFHDKATPRLVALDFHRFHLCHNRLRLTDRKGNNRQRGIRRSA